MKVTGQSFIATTNALGKSEYINMAHVMERRGLGKGGK